MIGPLTTGKQAPLRILSVEGAELANVTMHNIDLRDCRFAGAIGLDSAAIETPAEYWAERSGRRGIRDEEYVRTQLRYAERESTPMVEVFAQAALVAAAYRQLRKARETARDEPGATDFYYGEMEMRRLGVRRTSLEYVMLSLYWVTSGYSLRARRALGSLFAVVIGGGVLLGLTGLASGASIGLGLVTATEVATLRSSSEALTLTGRISEIPLRLLVPLIFLQLVFALRARVHR